MHRIYLINTLSLDPTMLRRLSALTACLLVTLSLTACGGGGDNPGTSANPNPPANGGSGYAAVPVTYPVAGWQADALEALNALRAKSGAAAVLADARLTIAADGHYEYFLVNRDDPAVDWGHTQIPGKPGFTGITHTDRAQAAGYMRGVAEVMAGAVSGADCVANLAKSPPHLAIMLDPVFKHAGFAVRGCVIVLGTG